MPSANIHDRISIERVYPRDAYASDAADNDRHRIEILHGVRVTAAPDESGDFELQRAALHAGEVPGAAFLARFHRRTADEHAKSDPDPQHGYDGFVSEIIAAAQRYGYRAAESPGPGDARLKGARQ
jgi:hypothetical protein